MAEDHARAVSEICTQLQRSMGLPDVGFEPQLPSAPSRILMTHRTLGDFYVDAYYYEGHIYVAPVETPAEILQSVWAKVY